MRVLKQWGCPHYIKVDNGRPFGDPINDVPPLLALWLIGSGIKVIWNRPRQPTDNATVERMQAVTANWSEPEQCRTLEQLQQRLDHATRIQRERYPVRRLKGETRMERYPELPCCAATYCPGEFALQRIFDFLAERSWVRKVAQTGQISFFGERWQLGAKYQKQYVCLKLDPLTLEWVVCDENGDEIKRFSAYFLNDEKFWLVSIDQRT